MDDLKQQFAELSSDYLLQKRASGDGISEEAHRAIEEIFAERQEHLPVRPSAPIVIAERAAPIGSAKRFFKYAALTVVVLVAYGVARALSKTWIGHLAGLGVIIYFVIDWFRFKMLSPGERDSETNEKEARKLGLSEAMVCASTGDLQRLREIVNYGGDVNARSIQGATALMYAVKNNHVDVVQFLLAAGADPKLKSNKGASAMDIARKSGNAEIVMSLDQAIRFTGTGDF